MTFFQVLCRWCDKFSVSIALLVILLLGSNVVFGQSGVNGPAQFWPQFITPAVVLGVGAAVIKMFFAFKDEVIRQTAQDKKDRTEEMREYTLVLEKMNYLLLGIEGQGGLIAELATDRLQRHNLNGLVHKHGMILQELTETIAMLCQKNNVHFDRRLLDDVKS